MKRSVTAVLGAAAMVLWASAASAQTKFDGKWAMDAEKTAASNPAMQGGGGGGGGGGGARMGGGGMGGGAMTITVVDNVLNITRTTPNGEMTTSYKLDDSEQTITQGPMEIKAKSKWDGDKSKVLVVTTRPGRDGGAPTTSKAEYSIDGDYLVITTTGVGRDGNETTRKAFYKKAS